MTDPRRDVADWLEAIAGRIANAKGWPDGDLRPLYEAAALLREPSEGREPVDECGDCGGVLHLYCSDCDGEPSGTPSDSEPPFSMGEMKELLDAAYHHVTEGRPVHAQRHIDLARARLRTPSDSPAGEPYHATDREGHRWMYRDAIMAADAHGCVLVPEVSFNRMKRCVSDSPAGKG